uniref:Nucleosome assembly protein n=1 Tax=Proboscia inermis TaxID=420281 RepID=A0A6T8H1D7_9STRA|mmetsp:Transcript_19189/g.19451  ORF Transcript_19189/g.19451 Transcript_19189/m.19451 type:complete len:352 (+) Transcript_19189:579-1634(+)
MADELPPPPFAGFTSPPPGPEQPPKPPTEEEEEPVDEEDAIENENENEPEEAEEEDDDDDEDDMMAMMPDYMVKRVEKLKDLNDRRDIIMKDYLRERAELENKYFGVCKPMYVTRAEIVAGKMDDEIKAGAKAAVVVSSSSSTDDKASEEAVDNVTGIPQFWVCAMGHMEAVAELITEQDVDCLEYCTDIRCNDDEDGMGFTLCFHFSPNEYFSNEMLTKRYDIPNLLLDDEPILQNVNGCDIDWKENKCLTTRTVTRKQRGKSGKRAGQIRVVTRKERTDSFFHFFSPPQMPGVMEEMDEEQADAIEEAFDHDYDVAQAFRSHIIPKAVLWFTGEALDVALTPEDEAAEE